MAVESAEKPMNNDRRNIFGFEKYPDFVLDSSRFPQDSFLGRWLHFNDMIDPRTLFVSGKTLDNAAELLKQYKNGTLVGVTNEELWKAQKITQSTLHPDTGHKVFMPFRMSGYVPFGSPMVVGLLLPNPSLAQSVFWQWLNQSHNACVNYANRNATKHTPTSKFLQGYLGAVTTAVSIAVGLTVLIRKAEHFQPATKLIIQRFVPLPAVCSGVCCVGMASTCNVLLMRWHEKSTGIEVLDSDGNVVGTSKVAAKKALAETAATRAFLPAPIFFFPPLIMTQLERLRFLKLNPRLHLPINAVVCTLTFALSLPVAIALFPQTSKISTSTLEEELRFKTNDSFLFYNKGL